MLQLTKKIQARNYYFKKLNDPYKYVPKYTPKKGFQYEENTNYSTQNLSWNIEQGGIELNSFPYGLDMDSNNGPIRYRDYRSNYRDLDPDRPRNWYTNEKGYMANQMDKMDVKGSYFYQKYSAKIGPRVPTEYFPFLLGDKIEIKAGKSKGQTGNIDFIIPEHNYIFCNNANFDYGTQYLKDAIQEDKVVIPRALLTEHVKLLNPNVTSLLEFENLENEKDENHGLKALDLNPLLLQDFGRVPKYVEKVLWVRFYLEKFLSIF